MEMEHDRKGNCWNASYRCTTCGHDNFCDVCHKHDELRGECPECPPCQMCVKEANDEEAESEAAAKSATGYSEDGE